MKKKPSRDPVAVLLRALRRWALRGMASIAAVAFSMGPGGMAHAATPAAGSVSDLRPYATRPGFALVRNAGKDAPVRVDMVRFDPISKKILERRPTTLACERVHLARQSIFCLGTPQQGSVGAGLTYAVTDFRLETVFSGKMPMGMAVSRARVSPDATHAGSTVFIAGHAYGAASFATQALVIDLRQRRLSMPPLENWNIFQNNVQISSKDMNLWGVSFDPRNPDLFYVTAAIKEKPYLARGSISARRIDLLRPDIECPSVSPDGSKLAFKKRQGKTGWAPAVLDLASGRETVFQESRSIDDQIEWLDNHTLVYELNSPRMMGVKTDLRQIDIRQPQNSSQLWLENAASPAILR
ncbi:hypothetical protein [Janthinobacterium sp. 17J80-10]|uniref:hypothetical protein n=1 Tax=Janthinobacterium sp. 17J80-10 TaxID=2497863 RepID=UPI0010052BD2|nr:hypothetical protein [Janthinobacterium sp. 17J80-10]QAU34481.1 hypothetical protein EKL02_09975 [Janthinobacterium sp. 17J80-10]